MPNATTPCNPCKAADMVAVRWEDPPSGEIKTNIHCMRCGTVVEGDSGVTHATGSPR